MYELLVERYGCKLCNETFQFKSEVTQHKILHVGEQNLSAQAVKGSTLGVP